MSLELAKRDLFGLIEKLFPNTLDIRFIRGIFFELANSLNYLHDHDIAHNDFKLDNVFLFEGFFPKLADFGFATKIQSRLNDSDGSMVNEEEGTSLKKQIIEWSNRNPKYLAPEIQLMLQHQN